ncbi:BPM6 [Symbiodinium sp. CCMP2592]|nr:BPM6 [Symbiodinium sp. CCMP2592]
MEDATSMSADELRAAIEDERRQAEAEEARFPQLQAETEQARERRRLRQELHDLRCRRSAAMFRNDNEIAVRRLIDRERPGRETQTGRPSKKPRVMQARGGESAKFGDRVAKGEYLWRIEGFSWVPSAIAQGEVWSWDWVRSASAFELGGQMFEFRYSPCVQLLRAGYRGSLAIMLCSEERVALRYRIYVMARNGEFVQWGQTCEVVHSGNTWLPYGPDVHESNNPPPSLGIFGLSHEELLRSDWVQNDTLTVKFELEVRLHGKATKQCLSLAAEVPEPTIIKDTRALLEEGTCSDVRFMVQDEVIQAHSQILCARSEVFRKQLTGGMQESVSKIVNIEDCDADIFKAFLHFLYTDSFPEVKDFIPAETSSNDEAESGSPTLSRIEALLAVSHKYGVTRLQLWCEATLSEAINTAEVCGILCQAHLLQAKQLERACLSFIKDHASQVLTLPSYVEMLKQWPQIGVKVTLFSAGVSDAEL